MCGLDCLHLTYILKEKYGKILSQFIIIFCMKEKKGKNMLDKRLCRGCSSVNSLPFIKHSELKDKSLSPLILIQILYFMDLDSNFVTSMLKTQVADSSCSFKGKQKKSPDGD